MRNINIGELKKLIKEKKDDLEIIDVREVDEFEVIKIKNSKLIPLASVKDRINEIDWNKTVIFVCRSGARSAYIANTLKDKEILNLAGGLADCYNDKECRDFLEINNAKIDNYL